MSGPARISDDLLYDAGLTRAVLATVRREINGSEREAYNHWMLISERFRQHYQDATHETRSNPGRRSKTKRPVRRNPHTAADGWSYNIKDNREWGEIQIIARTPSGKLNEGRKAFFPYSYGRESKRQARAEAEAHLALLLTRSNPGRRRTARRNPVHMRPVSYAKPKSHGGYGSAYAQGRASGNLGRPRRPSLGLYQSEQAEWYKGYDDARSKTRRNPVRQPARSRYSEHRFWQRRSGAGMRMEYPIQVPGASGFLYNDAELRAFLAEAKRVDKERRRGTGW